MFTWGIGLRRLARYDRGDDMHIRLLLRARMLATLAFSTLFPLAAQAQIPTPNANQYGLAMIGAPAAWALGYSGAGITVAVSDTGIDTTHPAFAGKIDPRSTNFTLAAPGTAYVANQITDTGNHGTHVAGIIAASGASGRSRRCL
jgi:subtilisin family serine protease